MADDFSDLLNQQAFQSLNYGNNAANLADPFMGQRGQYQNQLSQLMKNPGDFASSPVYKFAYDQGLGALNASAAARGRLGSGNYLKDLMDYGQGKASQLYFPQANLLAQLAQGGSSPAAAGLSYARGTERSQDYRGLSAANKAAGPPASSQQPWWMQGSNLTAPSAPQNYGLPSGGSYSPSQLAGAGYPIGKKDPRSMTLAELNAELGISTPYTAPTYTSSDWGWDMSNDPYAPASLQNGNTLDSGSF